MTTEERVLVTDIKQWAYCPRVVYYQRVFGNAGRSTYKMDEGKSAQHLIESLEMRRGLKEYGWEGAERRFAVWLEADSLGLAGKLDLLLVRHAEAAPVEFKLTSGDLPENHRLQLVAYAVLAEAALGLFAASAFWYRIPDNHIESFEITSPWRDRVARAVEGVRSLASSQWCPEPTSLRNRCTECEYANYCGDIW